MIGVAPDAGTSIVPFNKPAGPGASKKVCSGGDTVAAKAVLQSAKTASKFSNLRAMMHVSIGANARVGC